MTNKSPAFQWYPKDILSSARVQMMSMNEECAYRRLIDFCWINGSVPADPARAARLVGKNCTPEVAKVALEMFEPDPTDPDKLIHDRLEVERAKQETNSIARRRASEARWNKQGKSDENGKSGKPAAARGKRDEADNQSGSNVKSKSDANGYANALQTDMQNDPLHTSSSSSPTNTFSKEKDIGRQEGESPPNPPPKIEPEVLSKEETQDEYLIRKQLEYPKLDVHAVFKRYISFCKQKRKQPKRRFFDDWLKNEDEPLTADFTGEDENAEIQRSGKQYQHAKIAKDEYALRELELSERNRREVERELDALRKENGDDR